MFADKKLTKETLQMLEWSMLKKLGVTSVGEALCIFKQAKEAISQTTYTKVPAAKFPQLNLEMTPPPTIQKILNWLGCVCIPRLFGECWACLGYGHVPRPTLKKALGYSINIGICFIFVYQLDDSWDS